MAEKRSFIGTGWTFPIKPTNGSLRLSSGDHKIRQSIWLILSTAPGERQMRPEFGCGLHDLVFEANTATLLGLVREKISEALLRFEPRIDVLGVRVESEANGNRIDISIDYRVRTNNAVYNLVYPFFLTEGVSSVG